MGRSVAITQFLLPALFILSLLVCETNLVKIHRAYPRSAKAKFESTSRTTNERNSIFSLCEYLPDLSRIFIKKEVWFYSILATLLVGMCGIFPLLVIPVESGHALREGVSADRLKLLLSFAVGGLLGDIFLHLLPEAWAHIDPGDPHDGHMKIGLWVIVGILTFLILEKVFGETEDGDKQTEEEESKKQSHQMVKREETSNGIINGTVIKDKIKATNGTVKNGYIASENSMRQRQVTNKHEVEEKHKMSGKDDTNADAQEEPKEHIKVMGYLNLMANCIDNFTHGLAVAGSFVVSKKVGMCTTCAILLHEIPHEVGDFAILLKSGFRRWDAAVAQVITASGGLVGAMVGLLAEHAGDSTAFILPFTSGGFIYIAMVTIVPELLQENRPRESIKQVIALVAGIASMGLVSLLH